ncbi:MAG: COG1361 S-layer family protein [Candidatus Aenigmarchaeota archaeon]|nr:COG1361 S-layer family protein [Candidatus Aenigmarchaeota archaeon]
MNTMKFLGIFVMYVLFLNMASFCAADSATLDVSVLKYEPTPAEPGRYIDIWFKVDNTGTDAATDATLTLEPKFPFSTDDDPVISIGILNPLDSTTIKYRIRIDENAVEGTNDLDVKYSANPKTSIMVSKSFGIEIRTSDAEIVIDSVKTSPSEFYPGQKGTVTLVTKNLADSTLRDVTVNLDLSGTTTPFAPVDTTTSSKFKTMAAGETKTINYGVVATPDAASGIYKVPVTITFSDGIGTNYVTSTIISLIVGGTPDILTNIEPEKIFLSGTTGDIRVNIVNRGLVDIKYVTVKVTPTNDFEVLTNDEIYVGNIDSDDFDSASFTIHTMPSFSGELAVPIIVSYMNANNKAFELKKDLNMRIYTADEAKSLGLISGGSSTSTTIIVLVVVGYFGYRWYKKRKSKQ